MNEKNEEKNLTQKDNEENKNPDEVKITENNRKESSIKDLLDSNKKDIKRKATRKSTLKRKLFERPEYVENTLDKEILVEFDFLKIEPEIFRILVILTKKYQYRTEKENKIILSYLTKIKMNEVIKSDLLESDLKWKEMFSYMEPYFSGKTFKFYDTIFYSGEESDFLYVILSGKIGRYSSVEINESISCEEYLLYLYNSRERYLEMLKDGPNGNKEKKININNNNKNLNKIGDKNKVNKEKKEKEEKEETHLDLKDDEYVDEYLLQEMIEKNKEIFPLHSYDDIDKLKEIIFKIKLSLLLIDGKTTEVVDLYQKYHFPITFLEYNKVVEREISSQLYLQKLSKSLGVKGRYYMKLLGLINQKVKILKYVKNDVLEQDEIFGNFELIDCSPKRKFTTRCESDKCLLLCVDKKMYASIIYEIQKNKREKEVNAYHSDYLFKDININYFTAKIFSNFKIKNLFKGDIIFSQDKNLDHFILVKDGLIELSLKNISFFELNSLIKKIKEILTLSAKKNGIDLNELFNFNMNIDTRTTLKISVINEAIHQKKNFIFSRNQNGFFGEYELFFGIPSLLTGTVASDSCKVYYYAYEKYKNLNVDTYILNESLKENSFFKLKTILKRLINIYNSCWKLYQDDLNKKQIEKEEQIEIKNNEHMELMKKKASKNIDINSPAKINPNLKDIFISHTSNNDIENIDDFDNFLKNFSNRNNPGIRPKFFKTSLESIKARFKSQNFNKTRINNIKLIKDRKFLTNDQPFKTPNITSNKKEKFLKSIDHIKRKINNGLLLKEFQNTMKAQSISRKEIPKTFLPPILKVPEKLLYNYPLFKTEVHKNIIINVNDDENIDKSTTNFNNKSLDKSGNNKWMNTSMNGSINNSQNKSQLKINNKSMNRSINKSINKYMNKSMNKPVIKHNDKTFQKSIEKTITKYTDKSIHNSSGYKQRNFKIKKLRTMDLKIAQFNVMKYRKEILRERNPRLFKSII
jgi:CRP-like cAMP-binding protein